VVERLLRLGVPDGEAYEIPPQASAWPFVFAVFALSRLLYLGTGALAAAMLPWAKPITAQVNEPGFLSYWAHWDGAWYSEIATEGYSPMSTTFFPIFPILLRLGTAVGGSPALWGVLISLVATLFALYFLYGIAEKLYGIKAARITVLTLAFFPTALFLNAVYTEALYLALTTGSFWAAYVRRDLLLAGLIGALAAATRNFGVLLVIPLGYEWMRNRQEFGWRGLVQVGIVPTGLLGYMAFLWIRFGDPLSFLNAQGTFWARDLTSPATALGMAWSSAVGGLPRFLDPASMFLDPRSGLAVQEAYNTMSFAFLVFLVLVVGVGFVVLRPDLAVYTFLITLPPVLAPYQPAPLMGLPRYALGAFPLFLILGYLLSRSRLGLYSWLLVSGILSIAFTALFVTWRWMV
jgi:hypothetical protein